ncbi:MAG: hypothetical protein AB1715_10545, partial [Acidobacteriota bacterium]
MTSISTGEASRGCCGRSPRALPPLILILLIVCTGIVFLKRADSQEHPRPPAQASLLELLNLQASPESIDYVQNKTQFQLHNLLTEQRHPKT